MSDATARTANPHRDAMKYLRVQAGVFFFSAFACAAIVVIGLCFSAHVLTWRDAAWMICGGLIAIGCTYGGRWSLRQHAPVLRISPDTLTVGATTIPLNATTTIDLAQPGPLPQPTSAGVAMFRLPGFTGFPHFDGGPRVRVRTGEQAVTFQPLLYGPAAFFGTAADPDATALVDALTTASSRGDVAPWLRSIFAPAGGPPKVTTSVTVFVVSYTVISALILAFLGYLFIYGMHRAAGG